MTRDDQIREYLEKLRSERLECDRATILDIDWEDLDPIVIEDKTYYPAIWSFESKGNAFFIAQAQTKKILGVYKEWSLGFCIEPDGTRFHLSQRELEDRGVT